MDCGKQFKFISAMRRHRRIVHLGEVVPKKHFCLHCKLMYYKVKVEGFILIRSIQVVEIVKFLYCHRLPDSLINKTISSLHA